MLSSSSFPPCPSLGSSAPLQLRCCWHPLAVVTGSADEMPEPGLGLWDWGNFKIPFFSSISLGLGSVPGVCLVPFHTVPADFPLWVLFPSLLLFPRRMFLCWSFSAFNFIHV